MASTAPTEMPVAAAEPAMSEPLYFNRELSWLAFNRRVLEESCNANYPLLERLRFLSISASNLDEFFMVRVAGLKAHQALGVEEHSADGLTPGQQLAAIEKEADRLLDDQEEVWRTLQAALARSKVVVIGDEPLDKKATPPRHGANGKARSSLCFPARRRSTISPALRSPSRFRASRTIIWRTTAGWRKASCFGARRSCAGSRA